MLGPSAATATWPAATAGRTSGAASGLARLGALAPCILLPVVLVLNPLVVAQFAPLSRIVAGYLLALDLTALGCLACHLAGLLLDRRWLRVAGLCWLITIPLQLGLVELAAFAYEVRRGSSESFSGDGASLHRPDDLLGWVPRPGAQVRHRSPGNFDVVYRIDAAGRRVSGAPATAAARLHLFGDSFTFGHGVADHATFAARLQRRLGPGHAVLNYGVSGYGLEQMYLRLERRAAAIRPGDLVLWTPISGDLGRSIRDPRFLCALASTHALPAGVAPMLSEGGFVAREVGPQCGWLEVFLGRSRLPVAAVVNAVLDRWRRPELLANADRILARAAALVAARGARFALIFLPRPAECLNRAHVFDLAGLAQPHRTLLAACPVAPAEVLRLRFPGDGHWTPAGHQWAADALLPLIEAGGPR